MTLREVALDYAAHYIGKLYRWAGDDPGGGFDCSGLMVEVLKAAGKLPREGDWNAAALASKFPPAAKLLPGCMVFWNRGPQIGHVEMVWWHEGVEGGLVLTIGASGGGSTTTTDEAAIRDNAFVKVRPIAGGWVKAVDPFL